jgi:hypothetical protein
MALGLAFGAVTDAAFLQWAILAQKLLVARHGAERFNAQLNPKFPPWPASACSASCSCRWP